jgi:predicted ester cyclase
MTAIGDHRDVVRTALEQVCARADMRLASGCYAEDFVDHVGRFEYRGLAGVERSTRLYRALIDDLAFTVLDQVAEGDRVATRFALTGSSRGRRLRLEAITLSRLRDGRIVEDWSAFDALELLRQLGMVLKRRAGVRVNQLALGDLGVCPLDQQARVLSVEQRPGDSPSPEVDPLAPVLGDLVVDHDVRELQPAAGAQHAVDLVEHRLLVGHQIDHPIGDHDID